MAWNPIPAPLRSLGHHSSRHVNRVLADGLRTIADWLFGFDFFISYSHTDGKNYPKKLLDALESSGYRVFLDQRDYSAGTELRSATDRRIRMSQVVVVISRPAALESRWVRHEVQRAVALNRIPVVIDVNGSLATAPPETALLLADRLHIPEHLESLDADPSLRTVEELRRSFNGVRQETRRLRALAAAAVAFSLVSVIAVVTAIIATQQRNEAIRQSKIALAGELAATSASQLLNDPQRSLDLSIRAMEQMRTTEARLALINALSNARLRFKLSRHAAKINAVTFSPDGRRIATAGDDGAVNVWDLKSGRSVALKGHTNRVVGVQFSPDGTRLATAGWDNRAGLWDPTDGRNVAFLDHDKVVQFASFSPDGKLLVTAGDRTPKVWDALTGKFLFPLRGHESNAGPVSFRTDGRLIATGGWEPRARIWDAETGGLISRVEMPPYTRTSNSVSSVQFSNDGKWLVTTSDGDRTTRVWSTANWTLVRAIDAGGRGAFFNSDGSLLLTFGFGDVAEVWGTDRWERVAVLDGHPGVISAVFSPDGQRIATLSGERTVRVWQVFTGPLQRRGRLLLELRQPDEPIFNAAFSPDGRLLVTGGAAKAYVWDVSQGAASETLTAGNTVARLTLSPDGKWLAAWVEGQVVVWDTRTWREVHRLGGEMSAGVGLAFSNDSRYLVTGGFKLDVWEAGTWKPITSLKRPEDHGLVRDAAFSHDNTLIAAASVGDPVTLWEVGTWTPARVLPKGNYSLENARFAPDGRSLLVGGPQTATVWKQRAGGAWEQTHDLTVVSGGIYFADFSPDGSRLVTAGYNGARVWDVSRWESVRDLPGHNAAVGEARFSRDGRWIITASDDGTASLWHADTGEPVLVLNSYTGPLRTAAFSTDGNSILTGGKDGKIRVYSCEICGSDERLLARARTSFARLINLSGKDGSDTDKK